MSTVGLPRAVLSSLTDEDRKALRRRRFVADAMDKAGEEAEPEPRKPRSVTRTLAALSREIMATKF